MRLLVIEILNAVLRPTQKVISPRHGLSGIPGHQARLSQALQCIQRWAGAQFRKLPAAHHL